MNAHDAYPAQIPHVDIPECTCADGIIARASDPYLYAQGTAPAYKPTTCPVHGRFTAKPDRIRQPFVSEWAAEAAVARIDAHVTASVSDATRMVSKTTMSRLEIHTLIAKYTEVLRVLNAPYVIDSLGHWHGRSRCSTPIVYV